MCPLTSHYAKERETKMNINKNTTLTLSVNTTETSTPNVHSKTKLAKTGSIELQVKKLQAANVHGKVFNQEKIDYTIQMIDTDLIDPADKQRDTSAEWATKRLIEQDGLNAVYLGILSVVKIPDSPRYKVFDGCGRLLMAQLQGLKQVPCLVHTIDDQEAAKAFAYMQSNGRRNLSKEIIFANQVEAGEHGALAHRDWLAANGLYIRAADDITVPEAGKGQEVKYRVVQLAYPNHTDLAVATVLKWIRSKWSTAPSIPQDLIMGMLHITKNVPETLKNGLQTAITDFFKSLNIKDITGLRWKKNGGNVHNQEDASVALGFWEDFKESDQWKASFASIFTKSKIAPKK
jgi:hypothetical protein